MKHSLKALTLIALGLYLYSRVFTGTLLFYIHERFTWMVMLAGIVLLTIGASYRYRSSHSHAHDFSWGGVALVGLVIVLGLVVPPKPLGALAMGSREVNLGLAAGNTVTAAKTGDKHILDWLIAFQRTPDPQAFAGQTARLIGFVYRDERFESDAFMLSRFVVSCCVADASAVGVIVRSPQAEALPADQWVQVSGHFEPGQFANRPTPILIADTITKTTQPNQPYLYP